MSDIFCIMAICLSMTTWCGGATFVVDGAQSAAKEVVSTHQSDFNLWWQPGALIALMPARKGQPSQPEARTLEDWRKLTGQDSHSLHADPRFSDERDCDFRLKKDSPAIDRAKVIDRVQEDYAGGKRPEGQAPDIGAYEWRDEATE